MGFQASSCKIETGGKICEHELSLNDFNYSEVFYISKNRLEPNRGDGLILKQARIFNRTPLILDTTIFPIAILAKTTAILYADYV